jgi:hypothetical protein
MQASAVIHEAVHAIETRPPIDVLANTIHALRTTTRVLGVLSAQAVQALGPAS